MQPHGGLIEDVRDIGEAGAQMPDHLGTLRLAARQRSRRPVEAEVPKPNLDEGVEGLPQRREQRGYRGLGDATHPLREVADLHGAGIRDVDAADPGGQRRLVEPGTAALRARGEGDGALDELANVRWSAS